ncbi:Dol-P-Glc:Glc(2)Man(9)GlcNAc(2)-PP-Dol alpha-1,2-glucosyltransferase, partial [Gryllus bimaculatus]
MANWKRHMQCLCSSYYKFDCMCRKLLLIIYHSDKITAIKKDLLSVVNMASFPVLYFFTFLYYTDTVSIMLVLLTYLLHLEKCNILAAATGLVSIAVRQTNVIWVAFFAAQTVAQILKRQFSIQKRKMIWEMLRHIWKRGVNTFSNFVTALLQEMWGYIIVCFGFLVFIYMNGGIVVGDKSAHEAV